MVNENNSMLQNSRYIPPETKVLEISTARCLAESYGEIPGRWSSYDDDPPAPISTDPLSPGIIIE